MESKNSEVLKSLINLPQLLKDNTELVAKIQQQIDYNNKTLGSSLTKFTETLTAVKEVKDYIKIEELKEVEHSFNKAIKILKQDLNNSIIEEVLNQFKREIEEIIDPHLKLLSGSTKELLNKTELLNNNLNNLNENINNLDSILKASKIHLMLNRLYIVLAFVIALLFMINLKDYNTIQYILIIASSMGVIVSFIDLLHSIYLYIFKE